MTPHVKDFSHLLDQWVEGGNIRHIDAAFGRFLREQEPDAPDALIVAAVLAAYQSGNGHSCLPVEALPEELPDTGEHPDLPTPISLLESIPREERLQILRYPPLTDPAGPAPLALVEETTPRLYLKRYYRYEQTILHWIRERVSPGLEDTLSRETQRRASTVLETLFPASTLDWARVSCATALRTRFSVITGGPGTGKTTAVIRILAAIVMMEDAHGGDPPRIRLAAPTGKAATRLQESIAAQIQTLPEGVRHLIPREVSTIHRLLRMHGSGRVGYDRRSPLPADVVVIDEASMMDMEITVRLLEAVPPHARVILLGDKDQLASVETGSILADLCQRAETGHYTPDTARWIREISGDEIPSEMIDPTGTFLDQAVTMLRYSYRFSADGGIGLPADAVRRGSPGEIPRDSTEEFQRLVVESPRDTAMRTILRRAGDPLRRMAERTEAAPGASGEDLDQWARSVLDDYSRYRILCAVREGPWGVTGINSGVQAELVRDSLISPGSEWYPGRPVMVTKNDYRMDIMNGDIGVAIPTPTGLSVAFDRGADKDLRWIPPTRLQSVETVFAMTVHKSQGSEFDHVVLVLPDRDLPVLTRELIYTGITRARKTVTLVERNRAVLEAAVSRRVERSGGLSLLLQADSDQI